MKRDQSDTNNNDWIKRYKVAINITVILLVAVGLLIFALYTPGREGHSRIDEPELFFTANDWIEYINDELGLSASFPHEPEVDRYEGELSSEAVEILVSTPAEELMLQYNDYGGQLDASNPIAILTGAMQGGLAGIEGIRLDELDEFEYGDYPAIRFSASSRIEAIIMEGVFILADQEMYTMLYISDDPVADVAEKFFSSLDIGEGR